MLRTLIKPLVAISVGVLLFFCLAEIASRVVFSEKQSFDVEMWRYAREVKVAGLTPGLRFEHKPGAEAHLMGVNVSINSFGLRDEERSLHKEDGVVRIAVIGDSVTFGWGVHQQQTYPRLLQNNLNRTKPLGDAVSFEVINFGVGNYGVGDAAAMLEKKVFAFSPDLVIYGAFINDAEVPEKKSSISILKHSMFAVWLWGRLDSLARELGWRGDYREYYVGLYREGGEGRGRVQDGLLKMETLCSENAVPLVVVMLPELHDHGGEDFAPIRDFYKMSAENLGALYVDLDEVLPVQGREKFWVSRDDAHPDAKAFRLYARYIHDKTPWRDLLTPGR